SAAILLIVAAAFLAFAAGCWFISTRIPPRTKMDEVMAVIEQLYVGEYSREEIEEQAATAMVDALGDDWSYYFSEEVLQQYLLSENNAYYGIGIVILQENGVLTVYDVEADSPASQAGILPGGELKSVDGQSIEGLDVTQVKEIIQAGISEGEVVLGILEDGELHEYTLSGAPIKVDPVRYEMMDSVGYIKAENFDARSAEQMIAACEALIAEGAEGLVFDMRFNRGGQVDELLKILDYILPKGDIFLSRVKGGEMEIDRSDAKCLEMPMAVLVNERSYSAAEFFAAALQEYEWATVVGVQTTGKGYAQSTVTLSDGSAVHISVKEYFTPKGVSLAGVGIAPDIAVDLDNDSWMELYYDILDPANDPQLQAALTVIKEAATE
ncbi:MAG: PDZ domain-containing protein, partial [Oscillospiraceae bacterium]|nr:PDZ domain-containing protein [Oscillospiraceae bacterium]